MANSDHSFGFIVATVMYVLAVLMIIITILMVVYRGMSKAFPLGLKGKIFVVQLSIILFCFILLTHKRSHREVYQKFQPNYDIFRRWCQGLIRPQVPYTPSLYCPIANNLHQHRANNHYRTANQI